MTTVGPQADVGVVVDDTPTLELPVVPASAVPLDGGSPAGVVPRGTPPSMVLLPPSRWSTWVAGAGAAAAAGATRLDAVLAGASIAARRARRTAVRQAAVAGRATWHGFVALLAAVLTLVFDALTWVFRHSRHLVRLAMVVGMVVVVVRAVPWGGIPGAADRVARQVQGWTTTTAPPSTTTTTEDPYQYDALVPYDEESTWPEASGEFDDAVPPDDPGRYDAPVAAGRRVQVVRPGQGAGSSGGASLGDD